MTGKTPRRKRGKRPPSRKAGPKHRSLAAVAATPPAERGPRAIRREAAPRVVTVPRPAEASPIRHPYVTAELRAIGILAAIVIVVLIVLNAVLS